MTKRAYRTCMLVLAVGLIAGCSASGPSDGAPGDAVGEAGARRIVRRVLGAI